MSDSLSTLLPGLASSAFWYTSPLDNSYNCIAWAAGSNTVWWWPDGLPPRVYWPAGVPREETLEAFAAALMTVGYVAGSDETLEVEFEKVALFADAAGLPTHAARQLSSGLWTSKLGVSEDIEHELRALEGDLYGAVAMFLKRSCVAQSD